jgi:diguanylate cyclase (GGDEF)-like protein
MSGAEKEKIVRELQSRVKSLEEEKVKLSKENTRLKKDVTTDPLTKVYNRRHIDKTLRRELSSSTRSNKPFCKIKIDIDRFKKYNDESHLEGDEILKSLSSYINNKLGREEDIIGRYGGDEFEIILPNAGLLGAYKLMNKIRRGVEEKFGITISGGIASSEIVGIPLLYGKSGRKLIEKYHKSGGNLGSVEEDILKYSEISGIKKTKVKLMLDNVYHFLINAKDRKGKKISYNIDSDYRKIGVKLIRKCADDVLLHGAKPDGRNRIYVHTRPKEMILNPAQKSYYGSVPNSYKNDFRKG